MALRITLGLGTWTRTCGGSCFGGGNRNAGGVLASGIWNGRGGKEGGDVLYTYPLMKRRFHAPLLLTHALALSS